MSYIDNRESKYVAYIDVLGFKEMIFSDKAAATVDLYFDTVKKTVDEITKNASSVQTFIISDCVILISDDSLDDLRLLLMCVSYTQQKLAEEGIWTRGGLSFDEVFVDNERKIIAGKGFVRAYLIEQSAVYPRVIIEPSILKHLQLVREQFIYFMNYNKEADNWTEGDAKLLHDNIGDSRTRYVPSDAMFVSYARHTILKSYLHQEEPIPLNTLYDHLRKAIYGDQKHYAKYVWLKDLYAEACLDAAAFLGIMVDDGAKWSWFVGYHDKFKNL